MCSDCLGVFNQSSYVFRLSKCVWPVFLFAQAIYKMKRKGKGGEDPTNLDLMEPSERTAAIFDKMDTNHDGKLSKEEFIDGCMADEGLFKVLSAPGPSRN